MEQRANHITLMSRKETVFSRREIEGLIAQGRKIIIVNGKVLKADAWLHYHPGGEKAIMHMVGRDATDEVNAYVWQLPNQYRSNLRLRQILDCTPPKHSGE